MLPRTLSLVLGCAPLLIGCQVADPGSDLLTTGSGSSAGASTAVPESGSSDGGAGSETGLDTSTGSSADASTSGDPGTSDGTSTGEGTNACADRRSAEAFLLKDATFEGGIAGQSPTQGPTGFDGEGSQNEYSTRQVHSGELAARMSKYPGVSTFSFGGRFNYDEPLVAGDEVWWRAAVYFPTQEDHNANPRLKFFRIMRLHHSDGSGWGYVDWYINNNGTHRYIYEPSGVRVDTGEQILAQTLAGPVNFGVAGDPDSAVIPGEWAEWQMHVRLHAYPADTDAEGAFVRFYKNGQLIHERSDIPTLLDDSGDGPFAPIGLFMTYWNGVDTQFPPEGAWYVDDFTVAVSRDLTGALPTTVLALTDDGYPVIPLVGCDAE